MIKIKSILIVALALIFTVSGGSIAYAKEKVHKVEKIATSTPPVATTTAPITTSATSIHATSTPPSSTTTPPVVGTTGGGKSGQVNTIMGGDGFLSSNYYASSAFGKSATATLMFLGSALAIIGVALFVSKAIESKRLYS